MTRLNCPHCHALLKSSRALKLGKRVTCVNCHTPFPITATHLAGLADASLSGSAMELAQSFTGETPSPMAGLVRTEAVLPGPSPEIKSAMQPIAPPAAVWQDHSQPLVVVARRKKNWAGLVIGLMVFSALLAGGIGFALYYADLENQKANPNPSLVIAGQNWNGPQEPGGPSPKKKEESKPDGKALAKNPNPGKKENNQKKPGKPNLPPEDGVDFASFANEQESRQIQSAIDRGVKYLQEQIQPSGSWLPTLEQHCNGYAALPALALLECGVPANDPAIQRAAAFLRKHSAQLDDTYDLGLAVLFLDRLGEVQDKDLLRSLALRLVAGQTQLGGWDYKCPVLNVADSGQLLAFLEANRPTIEFANLLRGPLKLPNLVLDPKPGKTPPRPNQDPADPTSPPDQPRKKPAVASDRLSPEVRKLPMVRHREEAVPGIVLGAGRDDNSNTQFALLGLWAARRHGVPTELSLELSAQRFQQTQNGNGGWGYVVNNPSKNTMTCVGLLALAMGHGAAAEAFLDAAAKGKKPPQLPEDIYIKEGLRTLSQHLDGDHEVRGIESRIELYYLWTLERVGLLYNRKTFGRKNWYQWGSKFILEKQRADGSWEVHYAPAIDTSFAILFLKRSNLVRDLHDNLQFYMAIPK